MNWHVSKLKRQTEDELKVSELIYKAHWKDGSLILKKQCEYCGSMK